MRLLLAPLRLLDPLWHLENLNAFIDGFIQTYRLATPVPRSDVIIVNIRCACGNRWQQTRPSLYGGQGGSPRVCPACDGVGEIMKKVSGN